MEIEVVNGRQAGIGYLIRRFEGLELLLVVLMQYLRDCGEVKRVYFTGYVNQGCRVIALLVHY